MNFITIIRRAKKIQAEYKKYNLKKNQKPWTVAEYTQGFVGDVGDLSKLIMAKNRYRHINDVDSKIAHELADCLWSIIIISSELGIDLEKEFASTMNEIESKIKI